jgi:hypothetical protein
MSLIARLTGAISVARRGSRELSPAWGAGVSAVWLGVGLATLLALTAHVEFAWSPTPGLHSWVSERRYPIQQQIFWFYAFVLAVPASVAAGHFVWWAMASLLARSGLPIRTALRAAVPCFVPLLVVWPPLSRLQPAESLAALGMAAAGSVIALALVAAVSRLFASGSPAEDPPPRTFAEPRVCRAREPRSFVRSLRLLFVLVVLPVNLYFACFQPNVQGRVDLFHEGEQLVPLLEVLRGGVPYRDVYLQHGFLENLGIPWLGATLFAPTLPGVRWMRALVDPLGAVAAYSLIVSLTGARLLPALLFAVLVIASPVGASSRALFGFCSLAVLAMAWPAAATSFSPKESARRWSGFSHGSWLFFCSGVLGMAAVLHSTEVGLYTLASGLLFLVVAGAAQPSSSWPARTKPVLAFALGALLAWIPFAIALARRGALDDFLWNLHYQTRYQLEVWGKPFPSPFKTFLPLVSGEGADIPGGWADRWFWWHLCPVLLTFAGAWLAHSAMRGRFRSSPFAFPLLLLSIAAAFYFRSVLGRADPSHLHYAVLFALLLAVFFADALWCTGRRFLADGASVLHRAIGIGALLAAAIVAASSLGWADRASAPGFGVAHACRELVPSRKRIRFNPALTANDLVPEHQRRRLDELASFFAAETTPDERVLDLTNQAAHLFFADRRSATRYFHIVYAALPHMQHEVVERLETDRTRFALLRESGLRTTFDGVPYRKRHSIVAEYVESRFSFYRTVGDLQVWKRKE